MDRKKILIAGLPESGKTTYLGALIHILDSGEVETALKYDGDPEDRAYLNTIVDTWLQFKRMKRTFHGSEDSIELNLLNGDEKLLLKIPDLSGETWKGLWSQRQCNENVDELMADVDSMMFFIHSDQIKKPISIMEMARQQEALGEKPTPSIASDWQADKDCPTQVMVVDILQIIAEQNRNKSPINLAIILSAWDTAESFNCTPKEFIKEKLPLLDQYLKSKYDYPNFSVYGVSAQGADLDFEENSDALKGQIQKLNMFEKTSERVLIFGEQDHKHDLSLPIKKLLK